MAEQRTDILISTGSRLHWGLLAGEPGTRRGYGGVGLMIDAPGVEIALSIAAEDNIVGHTTDTFRVEQFLSRYREATPDELQPPTCKITVEHTIPVHRGLGSGTQLGMAVAYGLALLADDPAAENPAILAARVGRGRRSAIGLHGFFSGGLLVDSGKSESDTIGSISSRHNFPEDWRILLITPPDEVGLSGTPEQNALTTISIEQERTDRLSHMLATRLLPAVEARDFQVCSRALFEFGETVGQSFSAVQGGTLASPLMRALSMELLKLGVQGHGQTSWGPTLFVLQESVDRAAALLQTLQTCEQWATCHFQIVAPRNRGVDVKINGAAEVR